MIVPLNLPPAELKLTKKEGKVFVWCIVRKLNLLLTPEEWVRQHLIHFLYFHKSFPISLIASEYTLKLNDLNRRSDIVVFGKNGEPLLIAECKATTVKINNETLLQIAQYNSKLKVPHLILSNGLDHYYLKWEGNKFVQSDQFPDFNDISN